MRLFLQLSTNSLRPRWGLFLFLLGGLGLLLTAAGPSAASAESIPENPREREKQDVVGHALSDGLTHEGAAGWQDGWRLSLPGWRYVFPQDHHAHPEFKTEWWYFTGNLQDKNTSQEFGYQLTFFRQGIIPALPSGVTSRWAVRDLSFAHFAVSDLSERRFVHFSRWSRGSFGEAGFGDGPRVAWIRDWSLRLGAEGNGEFFLEAKEEGKKGGSPVELQLHLQSAKGPVFHGVDGVSQKAAGPGRASHYYSFTRLRSEGQLRIADRVFTVRGWSWYDHEWATNQLTAEQEGWDWFSLQFEDDTELMLFQIRRRDGTKDPFSSGTFVKADGTTESIGREDFSLRVEEVWRSPDTGGEYPVAWQIAIPKLDWTLRVQARLPDQEFREPPVIYWEGAIQAEGMRNGKMLVGRGYLEMTGYAGAITGMQEPAIQARGQSIE